MMKEAVDFLNSIKNTDGIVVIYNNDGDGISSCAVLMKFLERTGRKKPYIISQPMPMDKNLVQRIKTTVPHKIIFLDMAADQQENIVRQARGICDVMVIDHHQVHKNLNSGQIDASSMRHTPAVVHYNPRIEKHDVYQSTSYCIYKICSRITDMSDALWISGVGMVADYNLDDSKDLVKELRSKHGLGEKLYDTKLGRIADMISATSATKAISYDQMVDVMTSAKDLETFEETRHADKMVESNDAIKKEMQSLVEDAESTMERSGKVMIYNIRSKYNLSSPLSTRISEKYPKNLVVIYQINGNKLKVSSRNQAKNINAGRVMERAAKSVGGSGGGHDAAAGATILPAKWDEFKSELVKIANKV